MKQNPIHCLLTWLTLSLLLSSHPTFASSPPFEMVFTEAYSSSPNIIRIPFTLTGTLITLRAKVDTLEGNFFFDTGANGLVLNHRYFTSVRRPASSDGGSVTGTVRVSGQKKVDTLIVDNLIQRNIQADLIDLGHIERAKKIDLVGLLGYHVFKNFEILLDYTQRILMLVRVDDKGNPIEPIPSWEYTLLHQFPLSVSGHIAIIHLKFDRKKLSFGIDSGAEQNLLNHLVGKRFLKNNFDVRKRVKLRGASAESIEVLTGILRNAQIDTISWQPMATIITNLDAINKTYNTHLEGILGYEFLSQRIMSINMRRKRLCIYKAIPQP